MTITLRYQDSGADGPGPTLGLLSFPAATLHIRTGIALPADGEAPMPRVVLANNMPKAVSWWMSLSVARADARS